MSKGRKKYTIADMAEVRKELNLAPSKPRPKKIDEDKRKAQRAKFCRCPVCKGYMTLVRGTNTLICENVVDKTKERTNKEGVKSVIRVTEPCGHINVVNKKYEDFLAYLFNGVADDIAVRENKKED